ncbi:DUF6522 family protein [Mesorhizobium sp. PAMC28654]|uniref:DUF6522 family protein n=1 Tax=Mesorhizobium sp. PAMC28654 TaxID=2880934 RepID=UPI001D0BC5D1|nr:DUF6522 family protein [Mesorhizobium sp. PAMC28654]UDL90436.1 DUF6522 family protein [Mesorhizobium sp. PAMC28654]
MMATIKFEDDAVQVDAAIIGKGLDIDPWVVQSLIRESKITSRCERGEGADAGRLRLTFFLGNRRFCVIVDEAGRIIQRSAIDFGELALPRALRRPGG